jgi:hypothetical protein
MQALRLRLQVPPPHALWRSPFAALMQSSTPQQPSVLQDVVDLCCQNIAFGQGTLDQATKSQVLDALSAAPISLPCPQTPVLNIDVSALCNVAVAVCCAAALVFVLEVMHGWHWESHIAAWAVRACSAWWLLPHNSDKPLFAVMMKAGYAESVKLEELGFPADAVDRVRVQQSL